LGNKLKLKNARLKVLFFILLVILFLVFSGCGYKLQGKETLPFQTVKIGKIENRTFEPKLEDKLHRALADELSKNGFVISANSNHVINGVINTFRLKPLAERDKVAIEYEVIIEGRFTLTLPDGTVKELRNSGAFIVSFYAEGHLNELVASKENAAESALKNLASEIRAGIIYQQ
jgi:outer membrane lipopolysaccharide assembly protein LptE/RlpB